MDEVNRWVSRGKQLVDGVSGARPGSRPPGRPGERRPGARPGLDGLGRWVENRLEWLLEDGDDWREPWEEEAPVVAPVVRPAPAAGRPRRPLEAVSRRGRRQAAPAPVPSQDATDPDAVDPNAAVTDDWPDDAAFSLPRWQRGEGQAQRKGVEAAPPPPSPPTEPGGRPLPRSSRRRG
jgi:hypothetical protein